MPAPRLRIPPPVVIDCHFFIFAVTRTAEERAAGTRPSDYDLIRAWQEGRFLWVWDEEILEEYERTVEFLITVKKLPLDKREAQRIIRDIRAAGLMAEVTQKLYDEAYRAVMDASRPVDERDADDVIYLAAADASEALMLLSDDKALKRLSRPYKSVRIVSRLDILLEEVRYTRMPSASPRRSL